MSPARRVLAALLFSGCVIPASAHNIPNDVTVQALLKPEGQRLRLLVRVPLAAIRDISFPTGGREGYLDLARAGPLLPEAATLAISASIDLYEDGTPLSKPRVAKTRISLPSDRSLESWGEALAHVNGPGLPDDTTVFPEQGVLDALFEYPIRSEHAHFSIDPGGLAYLGLRRNLWVTFGYRTHHGRTDGADRVVRGITEPIANERSERLFGGRSDANDPREHGGGREINQ